RREGCQIDLLASELALARGGGGCGAKCDQPQPGDRKGRGSGARTVRRRSFDDPGVDRSHDQEEERRMPQRDLEPGPIGTEQRDRHDVDEDEEQERADGPAGEGDDRGQVDPVDQEGTLHQWEGEPVVSAKRDRCGRRREVADAREDDSGHRPDDDRRSEHYRGEDHRTETGPQDPEIRVALLEGQQLRRIGPRPLTPGARRDHENPIISVCTGASASFGSLRSRRFWTTTNPTATPSRASTTPRLRATTWTAPATWSAKTGSFDGGTTLVDGSIDEPLEREPADRGPVERGISGPWATCESLTTG